MSSVDPGEGWRLLVEGEPIPQVRRYFAHGLWRDVNDQIHVGVAWNPRSFYPMAVPVSSGAIEDGDDEYIAIEVHRAALAEIERLKAELDAVKQPQWKRGIPSEEEFAECWLIYGGCGDVPSSKSCEVYGPKESDEAWWEDDDFYIALRIEPVKQSQPDPGPEPEWFDLTPFGEHVLRAITDQGHSCISVGWVDPYWPPVTTTVKIAKSWGWEQFRCLLKDAPPELVAMAKESQCIHTFDCNAGDHSDACPASVPAESLIPTQKDNPSGLHQKYIVTRADGKPSDPNAVYFVLRIDGDHPHNAACRAAAIKWSDVIDDSCNELIPVADDLRRLVARLSCLSKPAEDPDEWVTQDMVPYRKELDQCKWDNFEEWLSFQDVYPSYRHGFRGVSGQTLQVRCRRRDLPPMPEQSLKPITNTYRRYVTPFGQEFWLRETGETRRWLR